MTNANQPADLPLVPWHPPGIPDDAFTGDVGDWRYTVLEEILDGTALLRRWHWPMADERGHLIWTDETPTDNATIAVDELRDSLYRPNGLARDPRIGDTYASLTPSPPWRGGRIASVHDDLPGTLFDVSAEARQASWLAYQGSLSPVRPIEQTGDENDDNVRPAVAARRLAVPPSPNRTSGGEPQ